VTIAEIGSGTQRVEAELERLLKPLPVFRLDSDTGAAGEGAGVLQAFERADSGVLVGTQMVAKGHDFPDVTLSVILDADAGLRMPDFRAEERTFALITQLAGRSGRSEAGGKVLVQALSVEAPSVRHAAQHDAGSFLAGELQRREALRYPPFSNLIEIVLAADEEAAAEAAAARVREYLAEDLSAAVELLGPAPLFRLRGKHRRRLLLKAPDRAEAVDAIRRSVRRAAKARAISPASISVDVDPQ